MSFLLKFLPQIQSFLASQKTLLISISPMILPKIKSILSSSCEKMKNSKANVLLGILLIVSVSCYRGAVNENKKLKTDNETLLESSKRQQEQENMNDFIQNVFDNLTKQINKDVVYDNRNATNDVKKLNKIMSSEIEEINNLGK
jgi:hypothetical protein